MKDTKRKTAKHGLSCPLLVKSVGELCQCPVRVNAGSVSSQIGQIKYIYPEMGVSHSCDHQTSRGNPGDFPIVKD